MNVSLARSRPIYYGLHQAIKGLFIWEAGRDNYLDGTISGNSLCKYFPYIYYESFICRKSLPGRFSSSPGKVGSRFAQPGSRQMWDSFRHVNAPSRFAGTILC